MQESVTACEWAPNGLAMTLCMVTADAGIFDSESVGGNKETIIPSGHFFFPSVAHFLFQAATATWRDHHKREAFSISNLLNCTEARLKDYEWLLG